MTKRSSQNLKFHIWNTMVLGVGHSVLNSNTGLEGCSPTNDMLYCDFWVI
jgi:hypothetical protein